MQTALIILSAVAILTGLVLAGLVFGMRQTGGEGGELLWPWLVLAGIGAIVLFGALVAW